MSEPTLPLEAQILAVLSAVPDPDSAQTITELGYVRTVTVDDHGVTINLQVPPISTSQSRAHLSAIEVRNALRNLGGVGDIEVILDDYADSDTIGAGTAFLRKAHQAAVERCVSALVRRDALGPDAIQRLILRDLPDGPDRTRLLHCRYALGLSMCLNSRAVVDAEGRPLPIDELATYV